MAEPATQWTEAQKRAIHTVGQSMLVSAAAGSGKTSVLAERCAYLVCDAPPPFRCEVTELLVVTFTEAAAAEMRSRIAAALYKRYQQCDDARLAHQLALIDRAQISTIHSFCTRVLRQNFHLLGLDPNFQMLSEEEGTLLRSEIAREIFARHYESDDSAAFARLIDRYGDGRDESLRYRVIRIHALLGSLVDPTGWIEKSRARLLDAAEKPMKQSALGGAVLRRVQSELAIIVERLVKVITQFQSSRRLEKYQEYATEILAHAQNWQDAFNARGIDGLALAAKDFALGRMPTVKDLSAAEETLKAEMVAVRDMMKEGDLHNLCRFSEAEWRDGMRKTIEPANMLLDLVDEFDRRYRGAKDEQRVLDFVDLEQLALRVLQDPNIARGYQQQFAHVLVDEYQDVNELQDVILTLVSREKSEDGQNSNFFCVGDVKQSIYRFRLAEPKRFLDRYQAFRGPTATAAQSVPAPGGIAATPGQVIDLQTNFRSRAPLLDTLNGIFARLMTAESAELLYDDSHQLRAPDESPYVSSATTVAHVELHLLSKSSEVETDADNPPDESIELDQAEREATFIAARIAELTDGLGQPPLQILAKSETGDLARRPLRYGDIAILLRSMKFKAEHFADILRAHGIPVHSDSGGGFFAATEVQDMLALLKVLDNQQQDIPLAAVLRSPIAAIATPENALAKIRLAYSKRDDPVPFHQAVVRYSLDYDDDLAARLRDFLKQIVEWRELAHRRPLAEVLWLIYDRSSYLAFVEGLDDGAQRVANLLLLHEHTRKFGTFRRQGLGRFMRFLDTLRDEIDDLGQPSVASAADDAVRIMSVHRSKGLEFPVVFAPDLGKRHNLSDSRGRILVDREAGIGLSVCDDHKRIRYPSLASTIVSERLRKQSLAEEMRVLYVATTRARERLILVGTCAADASEKWSNQWSNHTGPLPADDLLRGNCMLDWIGPALACMTSGLNGASYQITTHVSVSTDALTFARRPELNDRQRAIAELKVASSTFAPEVIATTDDVWNRLTREYPHADLMTLRASTSVTAIAHVETDAQTQAFLGELVRDETDAPLIERSLRRPRVGADVLAPTPIDIGTATHLMLQHVKFDRACTIDDLNNQLNELVTKRILNESVSKSIDLGAVDWLVNQTPLGATLRENFTSLVREAPINFPKAGDCAAPLDRVMVRGRIDALLSIPFKKPQRVLVIDFKTDSISGDVDSDARTKIYQRQLDEYARAIHKMLDCSLIETHLVYLRARKIVSGRSPLNAH
ncbi:MAG: helicase-exonuclease AddAB subunit AddA [Anaerolineae bacterium]|nr:helicase-exonuclease AddAB subunit AddA [Phycisphaerae bacterium]